VAYAGQFARANNLVISRGDGQSWDKVAEYPLIYLLDLRRSGWQVQNTVGKRRKGIPLGGQLVQQRLGVLEVGSVEALGEPVVDLGKHRVRLFAMPLFREEPCEANGRAKFA
jgi:hypothetical protein